MLSLIKNLIKKNTWLYHFVRKLVMSIKWYKYPNVDNLSWICQNQKLIHRDLTLLPYAFIGEGCYLYPKLKIGRYSMLAPEVSVVGADHAFRKLGIPICFSGREELPNTIIGDDVWVGYRVTIMAGVTIGDGAIIGAGSVVTKNVAPFDIVAGNPARAIGKRFEDQQAVKHFDGILQDNFQKITLQRLK